MWSTSSSALLPRTPGGARRALELPGGTGQVGGLRGCGPDPSYPESLIFTVEVKILVTPEHMPHETTSFSFFNSDFHLFFVLSLCKGVAVHTLLNKL